MAFHSSRSLPGNAPRKLREYLAYPRVLLTLILCSAVFLIQIAYGVYMLFFRR